MNNLKEYILEKFKLSSKISIKKVLVVYELNSDSSKVTDYDIYDTIEDAADYIKKNVDKKSAREKRHTWYCAFSFFEKDKDDLLTNVCKMPIKKFEEWCKENNIDDLEKDLTKLLKK